MKLNNITYRVNGAIFEVNPVLGSGFLEKVYENTLAKELRDQNLSAIVKLPEGNRDERGAVGKFQGPKSRNPATGSEPIRRR